MKNVVKKRGDKMLNTVKGYRIMIGKTQKQFAELLGISEGSYRHKELGKNEFKQTEMKRIIDEINGKGIKVSLEDIFFAK